MKRTSCDRFLELVDREPFSLSVDEIDFMGGHRDRCTVCAEKEIAARDVPSLLSTIAPEEPDDNERGYIRRVIRRFRIASVRKTVRYMAPGLVGAAIAGIAILAVLEILANRGGLRPLSSTGMEVRREVSPSLRFPSLDFSQPN